MLPAKVNNTIQKNNEFTIVIIANPFKAEQNMRRVVECSKGKPLASYIEDITPHKGVTFVVAVNGLIVEEDIYNIFPEANDIISITGEIGVSAIVAAIFSVVGVEVTTLASAWAIGIGTAAAYAVTYVAVSFAIGMAMNLVIGALFSPDTPSLGDGGSSSPTYGWGAMSPTMSEGNPIQIVLGVCKMPGQIINQYTQIGEYGKEYLNTILGVNDGMVDSIDNIEINEQPASGYRGIITYTRIGDAANDTVIPYFDELVTQRSPAILLEAEQDNILATSGSAVEKIAIVLIAPNGIYHVTELGSFHYFVAEFEIYYRVYETGDWILHSEKSIAGKSQTAIRTEVIIDDLTPARYQVKIIKTSQDTPQSSYQSEVRWTGFREVIKESLLYPGIAKYAVRLLATDQISGGAPSMSCIVHNEYVSVYDDDASAWVHDKPAANPAWGTYALLNTWHKIHYSRLVWSEFKAWADYCDEIVDGDYRHRANIVLDVQSNALKDAQKIASYGRGVVIPRGTKYGVFVDKSELVGAQTEPTVNHMFTMGNIIENSLNIQYLPQKDRANAIEITYADPDRNYTQQIVSVYSSDFEEGTDLSKKINIKYEAAITRERVIRDAAFKLNSNLLLNKVIEFGAFIDSFSCVMGDLVYFQHDVPHYDAAWGGRILDAGNDDGSGNPYVQIDKEVTLVAGTTYGILVRTNDNTLIERTLDNMGAVTTDTFTLTSSWPIGNIPIGEDLFDFGDLDTYKKIYRITNISRSQELERTITCMEYIEGIYSDTGYVIEDPGEWQTPPPQAASGVKLHEYLVYGTGGDFASNVNVSWYPISEDVGANWSVWLEDISTGVAFIDTEGVEFEDTTDTAEFVDYGIGGLKIIADTHETSYTIGSDYLLLGHEYRVYIGPTGKGVSVTGANTETIKILGKLAKPNDVTNFAGTWDSIHRAVHFTWSEISNIDLSHYIIKRGTDWGSGTTVVPSTTGSSVSLSIDEDVVADTYTYWIKAVDTSLIESESAISDDVAINVTDTPLTTPTSLVLNSSSAIADDGTNIVILYATWASGGVNSNSYDYVIQLEEMVSGHVEEYSTFELEYQWRVHPNTSYGVIVKARDVSGNSTAWTSQVLKTSSKDSTGPLAPQWATPALIPGFKLMALRWAEATAYDMSYYNVQRSTDNFTSSIPLGPKDGTFTTDTDLSASVLYYYRVQSVDTSGNKSAWSTIQSDTTLKVGQTDISYNTIVASHLQANTVSAYFGSFGTMEAGVLQSPNYNSTEGCFIDLSSEIVKFGGSANPDLYWNGAALAITGAVTFTGGSDLPWSSVTDDDGHRPDPDADVTANNTASDVTSVGGVLSSIIANWKQSGQTTINGGVIQTTTVVASALVAANLGALKAKLGEVEIDTVGKLYSTAKSNYASTLDGFFLGYDGGDYKLNIGGSTDYLKWDGSNLTMSGGHAGALAGDYIAEVPSTTPYWYKMGTSYAAYSVTQVIQAGTYSIKYKGCNWWYDGSNTGLVWMKLIKNTSTAIADTEASIPASGAGKTNSVVYDVDVALETGDTIELWCKATIPTWSAGKAAMIVCSAFPLNSTGAAFDDDADSGHLPDF